MDIKEFAEKFIKAENDAFQRGDFTTLAKLEDPNVVYHMYHLGRDIIGHEAHKQDIIDSQQGVSFNKMEFQYLTGEGSVFALSLKTNASGSYLAIVRVKNGRIVESWANGSRTVAD
jgi:hypothetical protein